jgi:acetate kinase
MNLLILNSGSTSQKITLYQLAELPTEPAKPLWTGQIDWSSRSELAEFSIQRYQDLPQQFVTDSQNRRTDSETLIQYIWSEDFGVLNSADEIDLVGHRVVHGGTKYQQSVWITPQVQADIAELAIFAPVHNLANLAGIEIIADRYPKISQIAVFDTTFHSQLPPAAYTYPGSYDWRPQGIRRYGFHGISHEYCAQRAAQILNRELLDLQLITCHLGGGCSLAAIRAGKSVDTTMGFTPLDGLMMGTRSGAIDPGILLHLLKQGNTTVEELETLLNRQSGLLGISGISADMRQIEAAMQQGNDRAKLAFEIYIHRLRSYIGAMMMSLDRLDALIFTAGVGEHSAAVRAATCQGLRFLGIELDGEKNLQNQPDTDIAPPTATVQVLILHTQEDWMIAQTCWQMANQGI